MSRLFAALDVAGVVRFVGEVPRGAVCDCVCPECGSPLIAKKGDEREWHFAHEAGQERPECEAGAMNLFRRLVVEHLRALPHLELPRYVTSVAEYSSTSRHVENVEWDARFVPPLQWLPSGPKHAAVATGRLDNGAEVHLFVHIGDDLAGHPSAGQTDVASVVFRCPAPMPEALRERSAVERHIARHARLVWAHHPDVLGLIETARQRVRDRVQADEQAAVAFHERQAQEDLRARHHAAEEASRRWGRIAKRLREGRREDDVDVPCVDTCSPNETGAQTHPPSSVAEAPEPEWPWAPKRKANTAFIFYRLKSGDAWVVYTMNDGSHAVAPWPAAEEGWDEALPRTVGEADGELAVYHVKELLSAMMFLASRAVTVRSSTDPGELDRL